MPGLRPQRLPPQTDGTSPPRRGRPEIGTTSGSPRQVLCMLPVRLQRLGQRSRRTASAAPGATGVQRVAGIWAERAEPWRGRGSERQGSVRAMDGSSVPITLPGGHYPVDGIPDGWRRPIDHLPMRCASRTRYPTGRARMFPGAPRAERDCPCPFFPSTLLQPLERRPVVPGHPILRIRRELLVVDLELGEVVEGILAGKAAGVDEAHETVAHFGPVLRLVEEAVVPVDHRLPQGRLADVVVEG